MNKQLVSNSFPTLLGAITIGLAGQAWAQANILEETVVTAQKRAQNLQEVPAAVEAFGASAIEDAGWRDVGGLQQAVPALEIGGESRVRPYVSIRGIGTRKFDIGTDGSVGLFIDEVYNARFSSIMNGIMDVERIEVLKGPQGTLYGRNTIGGAINIITRRPSEEVEGKLKVGVGNYGAYQAAGNISGPLMGDSLMAGLSLSTSDVEGIHEDTVTGNDNNQELSSARLSLVALPSDDWDLTLVTDYSTIESDAVLTDPEPGPVFGVMLVSPVDARVPGVVADGLQDRYSNAFGLPGFVDQEALQVSFKAKYTGESVDFLSITSYNDEEYSEARDFDGTVLGGYEFSVDQESQQFSQEFRFSSIPGGFGSMDDRLNWVAGLYYFTDDAERSDGFLTTPDSVLYFPPLDGADDLTEMLVDLETTSYALYGQATYAITENLNLTLGLRHTEDEKDFVYDARSTTPLPPVSASFVVGDKLEFSSTDPKVTLDYHLNDDTMIYATYSEGFKSGGVQFAVGDPNVALDSFDEEELTNIEAGFKTRLLDQRLQLNASVFNYDYTDQQVQSIVIVNGAPAGLTQNAAESDMTGAEIEVLALLGESITLDLKYAWLDASFDTFPTEDGDFSGNDMPAAPEHAFTASITHTTELPDWGTLTLNARYAWKDDQYFNFANTALAFQEDYGVVNLGAWWDLPDNHTRVRVFCDNCADEEYLLNFTAFPALFGGGRRSWDYGQRYGIELTYTF